MIGERPCDDPAGEYHYYWSNFPLRTPLAKMVEYEHRRCWIEQYHEEAKGELGWDQHQGRVWESFHRHAVTVMLAYSFLVWLEFSSACRQQVPGDPAQLFPPCRDRRRLSLPEIHRAIVDWLRMEVICELGRHGIEIEQYRPNLL